MSQPVNRVLGFDFGMKYIGVASGQTVTSSASPVTTLRAKDGIPDWSQIDALVSEWQPQRLVIGVPLNMDGTEQHLTFAARKFGRRLADRYRLTVDTVDERLTSWEAKQNLPKQAGSKQFDAVNAEAAVIIVQQWLNDHGDCFSPP